MRHTHKKKAACERGQCLLFLIQPKCKRGAFSSYRKMERGKYKVSPSREGSSFWASITQLQWPSPQGPCPASADPDTRKKMAAKALKAPVCHAMTFLPYPWRYSVQQNTTDWIPFPPYSSTASLITVSQITLPCREQNSCTSPRRGRGRLAEREYSFEIRSLLFILFPMSGSFISQSCKFSVPETSLRFFTVAFHKQFRLGSLVLEHKPLSSGTKSFYVDASQGSLLISQHHMHFPFRAD